MNITQIHTQFLSCDSVSTDTRKITNNCMFFALKGENFNGNTFAENALQKGARFAVVDDKTVAVDDRFILVDDVLKTLQELAKYHRQYLGIDIITLTGSNGKTTTKELINVVLQKKFKTNATIGNLNNHIGVPLTLLSMDKTTEIGVVEMGANHLKEIEFLCSITQPDFGYITNFGKAHLEGFGGVEGVIKGKSELYQHLKDNGKLIFINNNDPIQLKQLGNYDLFYSFSDDDHSHCKISLKSTDPFVLAEFKELDIQSNLIGHYNFYNISAAIAIGSHFKIDPNKIKEAIESYVPTNNRSQIIQKHSNKIILDAYNANPTSMKAALYNFNGLSDENKIAILGDMFELGNDAKTEHQYIAEYAASLNINHIYLVGENFNEVAITNPKVTLYKTFEDLKNSFQLNAIKNSAVLIKGSRGMALERLLDSQ